MQAVETVKTEISLYGGIPGWSEIVLILGLRPVGLKFCECTTFTGTHGSQRSYASARQSSHSKTLFIYFLNFSYFSHSATENYFNLVFAVADISHIGTMLWDKC